MAGTKPSHLVSKARILIGDLDEDQKEVPVEDCAWAWKYALQTSLQNHRAGQMLKGAVEQKNPDHITDAFINMPLTWKSAERAKKLPRNTPGST